MIPVITLYCITTSVVLMPISKSAMQVSSGGSEIANNDKIKISLTKN